MTLLSWVPGSAQRPARAKSIPASTSLPLQFDHLEERALLDADPVVSVLGLPSEAFIGESVTFQLQFDNEGSGNEVGYGPWADLFLDRTGIDGVADTEGNPIVGGEFDGLTFNSGSATFLGTPVTTTDITLTEGGVDHPYWVDSNGNSIIIVPFGDPGDIATANPGRQIEEAPDGITTGDQLVVFQLPFGSFAPAQTPAVITVSADMSNLADLGDPLSVYARGGFQFGQDPLNNPASDLPVVGSVHDQEVTPTLIELTKTFSGPESETATGPNFKQTYTINVEIAEGQTVTDIDITDVLPNNVQFLRLISVTGNGITTFTQDLSGVTPPTPLPPGPGNFTDGIPGGAFSINFDQIVGAAGPDAQIVVEFFVPLDDVNDQKVIDQPDGNDVTVENQALAIGDWDPIDTRDLGALDNARARADEPELSDPENVFTAKSIAIQKSRAIEVNTGSSGFTPNDIIRYELDFQVSDYFAFEDIVITDIFSDGQRWYTDGSLVPTLLINGNTYTLNELEFDSGNFTITPNFSGGANPATGDGNPNDGTDGTTTVTFRVSEEIIRRGQNGQLVGGGIDPNDPTTPDDNLSDYNDGGTTGRIVFYTRIQNEFSDDFPSNDREINQGDRLTNDVTIRGNVLTNETLVANNNIEEDTSGAEFTIERSVLRKELYAINGVTINDPNFPAAGASGLLRVTPDDVVTYRLVYTLPSGNLDDLVLTDFLPLPVFDADEVQFFDDEVSAAAPLAGHAKFGPTETWRDHAGLAGIPTLTQDDPSNFVTFTYGNFDGVNDESKQIDLLFSVTVSDDPFADGLFLTNQVNANEGTTNTVNSEENSIVQIELTEPELNVVKGVVGTNVNPATNVLADPGYSPVDPTVTFADAGTAGNPFTGSITSSNKDTVGIDSNLANVDGGDLVRFAVVIENTGASDKGAFDVQFRDEVPTGFDPNSLQNLRIFRGDGTELILGQDYDLIGGGLLDPNGGIELRDPTAVQGSIGAGEANDGSLIDDGSNIIVVTYDLQVENDVEALTTTSSDATVFNYTGTEAGDDFTPVDLTDAANVTFLAPTMAKRLIGTEVTGTNNNFANQAVIGELVTYELTLTLPEGVTPGAQIVDTLDDGLAFVDLVSVSFSSSDLNNNSTGNDLTNNDVNVSASTTDQGRTVTFTLEDIHNLNSDNTIADTVTIVYRAVVRNTNEHDINDPNDGAGNQGGVELRNSAELGIDVNGNARVITTEVADPVVIVEPSLRTSLSRSTLGIANPDADDTIIYTITLNHAGGPTAFDASFFANLPNSSDFVINNVNINSTPGAPTIIQDLVNNTFRFDGQDVDVGTSITITVTGTLTDEVDAGERLDATTDTDWTSMDGNVQNRSVFVNDATDRERTGDDGTVRDDAFVNIPTLTFTPDNYAFDDFTSITIDSPDIAKQLDKTQFNPIDTPTVLNNANDQAVIGEKVQYTVTVTFPEGATDNARIRDILDNGLGFVGIVPNGITINSDLRKQSDGTALTPADITTNVTNNGRRVVFNLGDIVNLNTNDGQAESITITYEAVVLNVNGTVAGPGNNQTNTLLNNRARLEWNNGANRATGEFQATNVRVIEPALDIQIQATPDANLDFGDTVNYTVTIRHTGGPAAYDSQLAAVLPNELTNLNVSTVNGGGLNVGDFQFTGNTLEFVDPDGEDINPGTTITVVVSGQLDSTVDSGEDLEATADITWHSIDGDPGQVSTHTPQSTERTGDDGPGNNSILNNYADNADETISIKPPTLQKEFVRTEIDDATNNNDNEEAVIGEIVTYRLTLTLSEGETDASRILDTLDNGLAFVRIVPNTLTVSRGIEQQSGDPVTESDISVATSNGGRNVTFTLGDLVNLDTDNNVDETIVFEYEAVVLNVNGSAPATPGNNQAGTDLNNLARFEWNNGANRQTTTVSADEVTVVEPTLSVDVQVGTDGVNFFDSLEGNDGADTLFFRFRVQSPTDRPTAFDATLQGVISNQLENVQLVSGPGSVSGNVVSFDNTIDDVAPGTTIDIVVQADVRSSVSATEELITTADVAWTSLDGEPGSRSVENPGQATERTGDDGGPDTNDAILNNYANTDQTTIVLDGPTIDKQFQDGSLSDDDTGMNNNTERDDAVAVGETVTFDIVVTLPEGTTRDLVIQDFLPDDLLLDTSFGTGGYQVITNAALSGLLTQDFDGTVNATPTITPTAGGGGTTYGLDFGNTVATSDNNGENNSFVIRTRAIVANDAGNQAGTTLTTNAQLNYTDPESGTTPVDDSVAGPVTGDVDPQITVAEPTLTIDQTVNGVTSVTELDAGDAVQYVITIANPDNAADTDADAFDLSFSDAIPSFVDRTLGDAFADGVLTNDDANISIFIGGNEVTDRFRINGGRLEIDPNAKVDLLIGETLTITIDGVLSQEVEPLQVIENKSDVFWTSVDSASTNDETQERDGSDDPNPDALVPDAALLNNYAISDATSVSTTQPGILKSVVTTSLNGDQSEVTIGEVITYDLVVTFQEGTTENVRILDFAQSAEGELELLTAVIQNQPSSISFTNAFNPIFSNLNSDSSINDRMVIDLGTVTNLGNNDVSDNALTIHVTARVPDIAVNADGDILVNRARLEHVDANDNDITQTSEASVDVVEPDVSIVKTFFNYDGTTEITNAGRQETVTIALEVSNSGTSDAFDVQVTDDLDETKFNVATVQFVETSDFTPTVGAGGVVTFSGGTLTVGETVTLSFTVEIADTASAGETLDNTADISGTSLPGEDRSEREYTDDDDDSLNVNNNGFGDLVWLDYNDNGTQETFEPGLSNVELQVTWFGPDNIFGGDDDRTFTVFTDADGDYSITGIPEGEYRVEVVGGLPKGAVATSDLDDAADNDPDTDPTTGGLADFSLGADQTRDDVDFAYRGTSSIGNTVFLDLAQVGFEDKSDPGLAANIRVFLDLNGDGIYQSATELSALTDAEGEYVIDGLVAGTYTVAVDTTTLPQGVSATADTNDGTLDGQTTVVLPADTDFVDADFGYRGQASLGDVVWNDLDNDGFQDVGEPGIGNVTVQLFRDVNGDGQLDGGDLLIDSVVTASGGQGDPRGFYQFTGLIGDDYLVVVPDANFDPQGALEEATPTYDRDAGTTEDGPNNTGTDGSDNVAAATGLGFGESRTDLDFGYDGQASLSGQIVNDHNADGKDASDPPISGVTVWLDLDGDGIIDGDEPRQITDQDGRYSFNNLVGGKYPVRVDETTLPDEANLDRTFDADDPVTGGGADSEDLISTSLAPTEDKIDQDFGYRGLATIGDTVFFDRNENGFQDTNEPGLQNVDVSVHADVNGNGVIDGGDVLIETQTTNSVGFYQVEGLIQGDYLVQVASGSFGSGEPLEGAVQTYDRDAGTQDVDPTINVGDGTTADRASATLEGSGSEDSRDDLDFGYHGQGSIGDLVWHDFNDNGIFDPGTENGVGRVTVDLYWDVNGNGVIDGADTLLGTEETDVDGGYLFENLLPGDYLVDVTDVNGILTGSTQTGDTGVTDPEPVSLEGIEDHLTADFGYRGSSSIGDLIWHDINENGVQDTDEPPLANIGVEVIWFGPDGIESTADDRTFTTTTDEDGRYLVQNLLRGEYRVNVVESTLPEGFVATFNRDDVTDSTTTLTLPELTAIDDADFGYRGQSSISGFVYRDFNNDGIRQQGVETGIGGIVITLVGNDIAGNPQRLVTTTASDGSYTFDNLFAGRYTVFEGNVTGLLDGKDTLGSLGGTAGNDVLTSIALGTNEQAVNYNFGEILPASITGKVFIDFNSNGIPDGGEPGISGVPITLSGIDDRGAPVSQTVSTSGDGTYLFTGLRPGTYFISEDEQPAGFVSTVGVAGSLPGVVLSDLFGTVIIGAGDFGIGFNFGEIAAFDLNLATASRTISTVPPELFLPLLPLNAPAPQPLVPIFTAPEPQPDFDPEIIYSPTIPTASISGHVFHDQNNNGVRDYGEPGIADVQVVLNGAGSGIAITDKDGYYEFTGLRQGQYRVTETQPEGHYDGSDTVGTVDGNTEGLLRSTDEFDRIRLLNASMGVNYDFGELRPARLSGYVLDDFGFEQDPMNGLGLEGVEVTLAGVDHRGVKVTKTTKTDEHGRYSFHPLRPGEYKVVVVGKDGYLKEKVTVGTNGGDAENRETMDEIPVRSGDHADSYNFRMVRVASLAGKVKMQKGGDCSGVKVTLEGVDHRGQSVRRTLPVQDNGTFGADDLSAGKYRITVSDGAGSFRIQKMGKINGKVQGNANDSGCEIQLAPGDVATGYHFEQVR